MSSRREIIYMSEPLQNNEQIFRKAKEERKD